MSLSTQQIIPHILQQDSKALASLFAHLRQLNELNGILKQCMDEAMAPHCQIATINNGCLIVITQHATWATQFRFYTADLLAKLRQYDPFRSLKSIQCKVIPAQPLPQQRAIRAKPMPRLSAQTAELIVESARTIKDDKLRLIMEKIALNV